MIAGMHAFISKGLHVLAFVGRASLKRTNKSHIHREYGAFGLRFVNLNFMDGPDGELKG